MLSRSNRKSNGRNGNKNDLDLDSLMVEEVEQEAEQEAEQEVEQEVLAEVEQRKAVVEQRKAVAEKGQTRAKKGQTRAKKGQTRAEKDKKNSGTSSVVLMVGAISGVLILAIGIVLCSKTLSAISTKELVSDLDSKAVFELKEEIQKLTTNISKMKEIDESQADLIMTETRVTSNIEDMLKEISSDCGLVVSKYNSFEKFNESGVMKAYYTLEGGAQVSNIVKFIESVKSSSLKILIEELSLTEGTRVTIGIQEESSSTGAGVEGEDNFDVSNDDSTEITKTTLVKDFRIVLQHVYNKGDKAKDKNDSVNTAGSGTSSSVEESSSTVKNDDKSDTQGVVLAHEHSYTNEGWTKIPTATTNGTMVRICDKCNHVQTINVDADPKYHSWENPGEACGSRKCSICGVVESKTKPMHYMSPWTIKSEPTCYVAGVRERHCINPACEYSETELIPKIAHEYITNSEGKRECKVCGMPETADMNIDIDVD